jgi:hypothetical protein
MWIVFLLHTNNALELATFSLHWQSASLKKKKKKKNNGFYFNSLKILRSLAHFVLVVPIDP